MIAAVRDPRARFAWVAEIGSHEGVDLGATEGNSGRCRHCTHCVAIAIDVDGCSRRDEAMALTISRVFWQRERESHERNGRKRDDRGIVVRQLEITIGRDDVPRRLRVWIGVGLNCGIAIVA